jgi:ribose transport system substrate-binding protein
MNANKIAIAASVLSLVSGTLLGCTNSASNDASNDNATNVSMQSKEDAKLHSVGVTVGDLSNPFFVVMAQGAEQAAKEIGGDNVRVTVVSSGYDLNQQFNVSSTKLKKGRR